MVATTETRDELFEGGPFPHIQKSLGLFRPFGSAVFVRAVVVIVIGWLSLLILVLAASSSSSSALISFLKDYGTHSRSLIAAPLFVICEMTCPKRLEIIINHFTQAHLIRAEDLPAFRKLIARGRVLIHSTLLEVLAVALAYLAVILALRYVPTRIMPAWFYIAGSTQVVSWAGWWYTVVTIPLLLILVLGWLFRMLLWCWFLYRVSKLDLRLLPSHPDHAAGLKFLNAHLFAMMPLAFTFGIVGAGAVANRISYHGGGLNELQSMAIGLIVFVVLAFVGPLMIFASNMHIQKIQGIYHYSQLANSVGRHFEHKWLTNYKNVTPEALEKPDFSATTDLFQIVDNVYQIGIVPFELRTLIVLCVCALVPFIPVSMMLFPFNVLLKEIVGLMF